MSNVIRREYDAELGCSIANNDRMSLKWKGSGFHWTDMLNGRRCSGVLLARA